LARRRQSSVYQKNWRRSVSGWVVKLRRRWRRLVVSQAAPSSRSVFTFVLERHLDLGPVTFDLAVLERHVERGDLCHPEVAQRLRGQGDGGGGRLLPRFAAGADELDHLVHAFSHDLVLPSVKGKKELGTAIATPSPSRGTPYKMGQILRSRCSRGTGRE
jgi:hypothetical protein